MYIFGSHISKQFFVGQVEFGARKPGMLNSAALRARALGASDFRALPEIPFYRELGLNETCNKG